MSFITQTPSIDPTGTYKLVGEKTKKHGRIDGYRGEIRVSRIGADSVVLSLEVIKGAPGYNSGSVYDTLFYRNNQCVYTTPEYDSTCKMTFLFNKRGVQVSQESADMHSNCGFGGGVNANGFYRRISGKTPRFTEP